MANLVGSVVANLPIPGAGLIADAVSFLTSFVKGKTKHASFEQVRPGSNNWAASVETAFNAAYTADEQLTIEQHATPLLLSAMQERWGMGGQNQPALANSITGFIPNIRTLAATLYTWIATNIDADSASEFATVMNWGWQYVFVSAIQQANLDPGKFSSTPGEKPPTAGTSTMQAGIGMNLILILVVVGIMFALLRRKG